MRDAGKEVCRGAGQTHMACLAGRPTACWGCGLEAHRAVGRFSGRWVWPVHARPSE